MSRLLKFTLISFGVVCVLFGAPLLLAPGKFLGLFGWQPVEPFICRMFGAALLGLAWGSFRMFLGGKPEKAFMLEAPAIFCFLSTIGILRHLISPYHYPFMVWFVLGIFLIFDLLWAFNWLRKWS